MGITVKDYLPGNSASGSNALLRDGILGYPFFQRDAPQNFISA
jgi:hypothetical protein